MTLLEKAKSVETRRKPKSSAQRTELLEVALAVLRGDVSMTQVTAAMGKKAGSVSQSHLHNALWTGVKTGMLRVEWSPEVKR